MNTRTSLQIALGIVSVVLVGAAGAWLFLAKNDTANVAGSDVEFVSKKLATIASKYADAVGDFVFDITGTSVAYLVQDGDKIRAVLNGSEGKAYDDITFGAWGDRYAAEKAFGPSARELMYIATDAGKQFVVQGDIEGKRYDKVERLLFSGDGTHTAYAATNFGSSKSSFWKHRSRLVLDGVEQEPYNSVAPIRFLASGELVWSGTNYPTSSSMEEVLVIGAKKSKTYAHIEPSISADGKALAYSAVDADRRSTIHVIWANGNEEEIVGGGATMNPTGTLIIYLEREGTKWHTVVRRQDGTSFASDGLVVALSETGDHVALQSRTASGQSVVIVDGEKETPYDFVTGIRFSPDGSQVAYIAATGKPVNAVPQFVVINGRAQPQQYGDILQPLVFSPDSERLAYSARDENASQFIRGEKSTGVFVVVDGERLGVKYPSSGISSLNFSPDSKHVVYTVMNIVDQTAFSRKYFLVVDGKAFATYDYLDMPITGPRFSADGKMIAYGARRGNELWWIAEDIPD